MERLIELADTSAWINRHKSEPAQADFETRLAAGGIGTCELVKLELLRSARDAREVATARHALEALHDFPIDRRVWSRTIDVLERLAARGPLHHRQVPLPDLVIAASAEVAEVPIAHYDRHFELIAEVTGQPVRAIAPLGSL